MADQKDNQKKEAFVGQQDRPDVQLNPDEPITNLRVRDLAALLATPAKVSDKFVDKPIFDHVPKHHLKDLIDQWSKFLVKDINDNKLHKDVKDHFETHRIWPPIPGPGPGPDLEVRQAIDLLVKEVAQLRQEVNQIKR